MNEVPEPLVPVEVDLRDYKFMPFYGERLFKSETWILCKDAERVAALRLWWASWHEEPAGSLPDNLRLLAEAAGYGVAISAFNKVRANAMRGWIKCSDGRLYHPVVCEIALDVWRTKRKKEADNAADRERKAAKRKRRPADDAGSGEGFPADNNQNSGGHDAGSPAENALKGKEGKGKEGIHPPAPSGQGALIARQGNLLGDDDEEDPLDPPIAIDRSPEGEAVRLWNDFAERLGLSIVKKFTKRRRSRLKARLADCGGIEGWKQALAKVATIPGLLGKANSRDHAGWKVTFDFLLQEESFVKLMEGGYDHWGVSAGGGVNVDDAWERTFGTESNDGTARITGGA